MNKIGDMPLADGDSLPVYEVSDPDIMRAEHAQIGTRHALRIVPLGGMWFMHMSDVDWLLATATESMSHERFWTQVAICALLTWNAAVMQDGKCGSAPEGEYFCHKCTLPR